MKKLIPGILAISVTLGSMIGVGVATAGSETRNERCDKYVAVSGSYTWFEARDDARERGGRLASVSSEEESLCVRQALTDAGFDQGWLGGSDAADEGVWRWVDAPKYGLFWIGGPDGKSYGYSGWYEIEPNDADGEDCLETDDSGGWNDVRCSEPRGYIMKLLTGNSNRPR